MLGKVLWALDLVAIAQDTEDIDMVASVDMVLVGGWH